jgi:hypothetical protein
LFSLENTSVTKYPLKKKTVQSCVTSKRLNEDLKAKPREICSSSPTCCWRGGAVKRQLQIGSNTVGFIAVAFNLLL